MEKVIVSKVEEGHLVEFLKENLQKIGFRCKGKILVKPNICAPKYIPGGVTSPKLVYSLVKVLRERAKEVVVGESDGYNYSCNFAFKKSMDFTKKYSLKFYNKLLY